MSATRRKQTGRDPTLPPSDQTDRIPTETPSTVYLKTLMEIKEDIGGIKSDISKLKQDVESVKTKQSELDKTISSFKTILKTLGWILAGISTLIGLFKILPILSSWIQ